MFLSNRGIALHRAARNQDFERNLLYWRNQAEISRWFFSQDEITIAEHKEYLDKAINDKCQMVFGIYTQPSIGNYHAEMVGTISLYDIDYRNRKAEMGRFFVFPSKQGLGYGSIALGILINYAFNTLGLRKLYCHTLVENDKAILLYSKHGFSRVGVFMQEVFLSGRYRDIMRLELFR